MSSCRSFEADGLGMMEREKNGREREIYAICLCSKFDSECNHAERFAVIFQSTQAFRSEAFDSAGGLRYCSVESPGVVALRLVGQATN
jgi:hypothetical protein